MDGESTDGDVTKLLQSWSLGDEASFRRLLPLVYHEMRAIARAYMSQERTGHTLQPTGLVHEAFLRFAQSPPESWRDRKHFYGVTARLMRQILVDHARRHSARKRTPEGPAAAISTENDPVLNADYLTLDGCLTKLEASDPRKARIVELRYFGGLELEEIAEAVDLSLSTIKKELSLAKIWMYQAFHGEHSGEPPAPLSD